jgi:3-phenylpropionate/trans-cinnamate dioxygenase ferredoxin component
MSRVEVLKASELPVGEMTKIEAAGRTICVAHLEEHGFRAIDDRCTHEDESLSEGYLCDESVECPMHSSRFSFLTGEVTGVPAWIPVRTYPVEVEGDSVFLIVEESKEASA